LYGLDIVLTINGSPVYEVPQNNHSSKGMRELSREFETDSGKIIRGEHFFQSKPLFFMLV
jgi:hypothetical protein